jgi:hypothetical protein
MTYGNVFRHQVPTEVCPSSLLLVDHILPYFYVRLLSILFSVSPFLFFQYVSNLNFFEVIFFIQFLEKSIPN